MSGVLKVEGPMRLGLNIRNFPIPDAVTTVLAFVSIFAIMILASFAVWQDGRAMAAQQRLLHASEVIQAADSILIALQNIETGQRGYLITGKPDYLQPYHRGIATVHGRINRLEKLLSVTPANARLMANLRNLVAQKLAEIDRAIQVRTSQGFNAAAKIVTTDADKQVMDLLRTELSGVMDRYHRRIAAEKLLATPRTELTKIANTAFGLTLLATLAGIYFRFAHALRLRKKLADKAIEEANTDSLTHLPNRALFLNWLSYGLAQASRVKSNPAILFLDLDGFKPINDRFGHSTGDDVLCEVAQRFKQATRGGDMIARIGGDEFAIFIPTVSEERYLVTLASRIIESVYQPIVAAGLTVNLSISIGAAVYPRDGSDPASLLAAADEAMYQSKRQGGGKLVFHDSSTSKGEINCGGQDANVRTGDQVSR